MPTLINTELHGTFCRQLKAWREHVGISQSELARRMHVKPSLICQLESGVNSPTLDTVERVAKALGVKKIENFLFLDPDSLLQEIA